MAIVKIVKGRKTDEKDLPLGIDTEKDFVPSEDDFVPSPPKPKGPLGQKPSASAAFHASLWFAACVVVSGIFWRSKPADFFSASGLRVFEHDEYWRLLTALFAHSDLAHLLANAPLFFIFALLLEGYYGKIAFPVISFAIGILTNVFTIYFYAPDQRLVGASGMVFGMIALWLVLYFRYEHSRSIGIKLLRITGFSLLMLVPSSYKPTTSYLAHGLGFSIGIIFGIISIRYVQPLSLVKGKKQTDSES